VGSKRKELPELYKIANKNHADKMIANYIFSTKQSFKSCNSLAYTEMVKAITEAGPGYIPPKEKTISGRLLDEEYDTTKRQNLEKIEKFSQLGYGATISSDSCTITKQPLTNYLLKYPDEQATNLGYDDATELYQEGGTKDTQSVYEGLRKK